MKAGAIKFDVLFESMAAGTLTSLQIFFITSLIALPLGFIIAAGRMSKYSLIRFPVSFYLLIMRGTPLMLQLFFFCYGPFYILGITGFNRFLAAIIAFGLNYAAYFAEIYRGGIESIDVGQREAAEALGFTRFQIFFKIILPQVVKRILPAMGSEFMTLVKDTALARVIAITELFYIADKAASTFSSTIPYIMAGAFYLIMNTIVSRTFRFAESKLSYYS